MPGANSAGRNRPERLESLRRSFEAAGVNVTLDLVDNVPHDGLKCVGEVQDFLRRRWPGCAMRNTEFLKSPRRGSVRAGR